jgi:chromosome segregation ATPase
MNSELEDEIEIYKREVNLKKEELKNYKAEIQYYQKEVEHLQITEQKADKIHSEFEQTLRQCKEKETNIDNLNLQMMTAKNQINEQIHTISNLETECKMKQKELITLSQENTDLRKHINQVSLSF